MPTDVDRQIARSSEFLDRTRERYASLSTRARRRREAEILRRLGRIALADGAIVVAAMVLGFFFPLGMFGALVVMALLVAATLAFAIFPLAPEADPEKLVSLPLKALPLHTEQWLETQRPALPPPARTLVDSIGVKLETLAPQLATLDEHDPAATEVRKLVGEQLPELVRGYQRVPGPLRSQARHGRTPDEQLVDGLALIEAEIGEMTQQLAQGDMDQLATRGRFLEIKYRDEDGG